MHIKALQRWKEQQHERDKPESKTPKQTTMLLTIEKLSFPLFYNRTNMRLVHMSLLYISSFYEVISSYRNVVIYWCVILWL